VQVAGSPIVSLPAPLERRVDVVEQAQRSRTREDSRGQADEAAIAAFEREQGTREEIPRTVPASSEAQALLRRAFQERTENLNRPQGEKITQTARRALQTFAENTPSPEQRLGIELVRIDIQV